MKIEFHDNAISFQAETCAEELQVKEIGYQAKRNGFSTYEFDNRIHVGGCEYGVCIRVQPKK
jgi:hypothetical protein